MQLRLLISLSALALTIPACAGKRPQNSGRRDSGQSRLMDKTFAGQNACNPDDHLRPFIVEWDATDASSFQSHAANDLVVVKYEGCSLKVLGECKNDSVRGEQGAYLPPVWTSGSLETIDISNEGELYAKLPLGQATLGARVQGGEAFHMEYYVAGTSQATRDSVYRAEIQENPGCEGATHFVYAYNLGAFALGSKQNLDTQANASMFGFGGGGGTSSKRSAEKKGGDLATCKSEEATEVMGCKAPIRLTLREIRDGENPNAAAMEAPDTPESLNAAGQINAKLEMSEEARAHYDAAQRKMVAGDGKGCLTELDVHDRLDAKHQSTSPTSPVANMRAQCLMVAGKCKAGKDLARKFWETTQVAQYGPEQVDRTVEGMMRMYCRGDMSPREDVLQAMLELQKAATMTKKDAAFCDEHFSRIEKNRKKAKPKDDEDKQIIDLARNVMYITGKCYERAGACDKAWKAYKKIEGWRIEKEGGQVLPDETLRAGFESLFAKCKGK